MGVNPHECELSYISLFLIFHAHSGKLCQAMLGYVS